MPADVFRHLPKTLPQCCHNNIPPQESSFYSVHIIKLLKLPSSPLPHTLLTSAQRFSNSWAPLVIHLMAEQIHSTGWSQLLLRLVFTSGLMKRVASRRFWQEEAHLLAPWSQEGRQKKGLEITMMSSHESFRCPVALRAEATNLLKGTKRCKITAQPREGF